VLIFQISFSQNNDKALNFKRDFYLERSANQQKAGLILLGSGTAAIVIGAIGFDSTWGSDSNGTDAFGFVLLAGLIADIVSIPLLLSSGANKRKANRLSLTIDHMPVLTQKGHAIYSESRPMLTLKIKI